MQGFTLDIEKIVFETHKVVTENKADIKILSEHHLDLKKEVVVRSM